MPKQMTPKQLVLAYKHEMFGTAKARVLREDHGFRMRQDSSIRDFYGNRTFELATTYYYRNQNSTARQAYEFGKFAREHGFEIVIMNYWTGKPIPADEVDKDIITFETNPWPKESWAKVLIGILEPEAEEAE